MAPLSSPDRCCCNSFHILKGTVIIGIILAIELYIIAIVAVWKLFSIVFLTFCIVVICLHTACLISLIIATSKEQHELLIPHLVYQGMRLTILVMLEFAILLAPIVEVNPESFYDYDIFHGYRPSRTMMSGIIVALIVLIALVFIVEVWWFTVVLQCYKYIQHRAKKSPGRDSETIIWETDTAGSAVYKRTVDGCIVYTAKKDTMGL